MHKYVCAAVRKKWSKSLVIFLRTLAQNTFLFTPITKLHKKAANMNKDSIGDGSFVKG